MDFNLVDLVLRVNSGNRSVLARGLFSSGGAFAQTCRAVTCRWPGRDCRACAASCDCGWHQVFSQELTTDPEALRRHQKPPLPFSFHFPAAVCDSGPGEMVCSLVVIGSAIPFLEMLLQGFAVMVRQQGGTLVSMSSRDYQGKEFLLGNGVGIEQPGNLVILSSRGSFESRPWAGTSLRVELLTPLRLVSHGRQLRRFEFCTFARTLLRRVSAMAHYYGQSREDHDFKALSLTAEQVTCDEYRFAWEGCGNGGPAGLTGYGRFSGNFTELLPFLAAGRYLNAGKGAAYGSGAFEVEVE